MSKVKMISLGRLASKTGIGSRQLRYVVDHEIVSHYYWYVAEDEVHHPRRFSELAGAQIAGAALLLASGCKRETVKKIMGAMWRQSLRRVVRPPKDPCIGLAAEAKKEGVFHFGDGEWMRWRVDGKDTDWASVTTGKPAGGDYEPAVVISLDFRHIYRLIAR